MLDIIQNCCVAICFGATASVNHQDITVILSACMFGYIISSIRCDIRDIRRNM